MTQMDDSRRRGAAVVGDQRRGKKRAGHPLDCAPGREGSDIVKHPYMALAASMVAQAYRDIFTGKQEAVKLDAIFWLASEDARLICGSLGFEHNPLEPLTSGQARVRAKVKGKG